MARYEQTSDSIGKDQVVEIGFSAAAKDKARSVCLPRGPKAGKTLSPKTAGPGRSGRMWPLRKRRI